MKETLERIASALERIASAAELSAAVVKGRRAESTMGPIELRFLATPGAPKVMRFTAQQKAASDAMETDAEKAAHREAVAQERLNALLTTGSGKASDETSALVSAIMAGPPPTLQAGDADAGMAMF